MPFIRIDREHVRNRPDVRLRARQEVIRQPPEIEQRPRDLGLCSKKVTEGLAAGGIESGFQGIGLYVAAPFGGNQALAGVRSLACGQEGRVDCYVLRIREEDNRDHGRCVGRVQDLEEGVGGVICSERADALGFEPWSFTGVLCKFLSATVDWV